MIEREKKRKKLVEKYAAKREELKQQFMEAEELEDKMEIHRQIQRLPRNSAPSRVRNRCWLTGRPRGYYRDFGLSRNVIREMAHEGLLPGVARQHPRLPDADGPAKALSEAALTHGRHVVTANKAMLAHRLLQSCCW